MEILELGRQALPWWKEGDHDDRGMPDTTVAWYRCSDPEMYMVKNIATDLRRSVGRVAGSTSTGVFSTVRPHRRWSCRRRTRLPRQRCRMSTTSQRWSPVDSVRQSSGSSRTRRTELPENSQRLIQPNPSRPAPFNGCLDRRPNGRGPGPGRENAGPASMQGSPWSCEWIAAKAAEDGAIISIGRGTDVYYQQHTCSCPAAPAASGGPRPQQGQCPHGEMSFDR